MAFITLTEARATLEDSVLHAGGTSYSDSKLDRAIIGACREFIRETNCYTLNEQWTIAAGDGSVAVSAITGITTPWTQDMYMHAYNSSGSGFKYMKVVSLSEWMDLMTGSAAAVASTNVAYIVLPDHLNVHYYPANSDSLTLQVFRRATLDFTIGTGTPNAVSIPIPEEWVYQVLWVGGKHYLLGGAPGHPDADAALQRWVNLLESAKGHFPDARPGTIDRDVHPGMGRGVR